MSEYPETLEIAKSLGGQWVGFNTGHRYIDSDLIRSLLSQIEGGRDAQNHPISNNVVYQRVKELCS